MTAIEFDHEFEPRYGILTRLGPRIRRVVANNPGPFTGPGTSTYILGNEDVAVIDPGPMLPGHVDAILRGLGSERISHIIVTHTHSDHSPAARLLAQRTGAPTFGFGPHSRETAGALEGGADLEFEPDFVIEDQEQITGADWQLEAIHTPGHCSNHLCFALEPDQVMFCGDQLMAWSTTVIMPPDGSIGEYLDSLERLAARAETTFYPTHGAAITHPREYIEQIKQHRLSRVEETKQGIRMGLTQLPALRQQIYPHLPTSLYGGAELSLLASIEYLIAKGNVRESKQGGETYYYSNSR